MLILTRKPGESLYIGDSVKITIVEIKGNQIRVGIDAPQELRIYREEIYLQIMEENKKAAEAVSAADLDALSVFSGGKGTGAGVTQEDAGPRKTRASMSSLLGSSEASQKKGAGPEVVVKRKRGKKQDD